MPHLRHVGPDEAAARGVAELYRHVEEVTGRQPSPFWQSQAVRPDLASPLWDWFEALMLTDGRLGRALKEMIATRVSYANACRYCSAAHSGRAKLLGVPETIVDRLADPLDSLDIDERQRAVLAFSDKVRDASSTVDASDWERLRRIGLDDDAIMEALQVVAMFSAFNRMADAFGVEFAVPAPVAEPASPR